MTDSPEDLRDTFVLECEELADALQDGLTAMAEGRAGPDAIHACFRAVHSIKGSAGAFDFDALARVAHAFESAIDPMRDGRRAVDEAALAELQRAADHLEDLVGNARDGAMPSPEVTQTSIAALEALAAEPASDVDREAPDSSAAQGRANLEGGHAPSVQGANTGSTFEPVKLWIDLDDAPAAQSADPPPESSPWVATEGGDSASDGQTVQDAGAPSAQDADAISRGAQPPTGARRVVSERPEASGESAAPIARRAEATRSRRATLRMPLARVDRLVDRAGELAIAQAGLAKAAEDAEIGAAAPLRHHLDTVAQLTRRLQDDVMTLRALPVTPLFRRLARVSRETAAALGKDVRFQTVGEETEIDASMIERLSDPLTHLVRNAIDHGLEHRDQRRAAGKEDTGTLLLRAAHGAGSVMIEVSDDGAGIDRAALRQRAETSGGIDPAAALDDDGALDLVFRPGISTAREVSDVSGRGVGLDIVRTEIRALGGRIAVSSTPGHGTRFTLTLPLTLAVLDGLVLRAQGGTFVIPLGMVEELVPITPGQRQPLGPAGPLIQVRGALLPIVPLASALNLASQSGADIAIEPAENIGSAPVHAGLAEGRTEGRVAPGVALVVRMAGDTRAALAVDVVEEHRQVVIKALPEGVPRATGLSAATILGDGRIALILDAPDLLSAALETARAPSPQMRHAG